MTPEIHVNQRIWRDENDRFILEAVGDYGRLVFSIKETKHAVIIKSIDEYWRTEKTGIDHSKRYDANDFLEQVLHLAKPVPARISRATANEGKFTVFTETEKFKVLCWYNPETEGYNCLDVV